MKRTDQIERSEYFHEYVGDPDPFQDIRFDLHARQRPLRPPLELDCHFDCVCEACTFFVTTIEFRPFCNGDAKTQPTKANSAGRRSSTGSWTGSTSRPLDNHPHNHGFLGRLHSGPSWGLVRARQHRQADPRRDPNRGTRPGAGRVCRVNDPTSGGQFRGHQWAETVAISGLFRGRLWAVFHGRRQGVTANGVSYAHRPVPARTTTNGVRLESVTTRLQWQVMDHRSDRDHRSMTQCQQCQSVPRQR